MELEGLKASWNKRDGGLKAGSPDHIRRKEIFHGNVQCPADSIDGFCTALFQSCFAVADVIQCGIRHLASLCKAVDGHLFFLQRILNGHGRSPLSSQSL